MFAGCFVKHLNASGKAGFAPKQSPGQKVSPKSLKSEQLARSSKRPDNPLKEILQRVCAAGS